MKTLAANDVVQNDEGNAYGKLITKTRVKIRAYPTK